MQTSAVVAEAVSRLEAAGLLDRLAGVGSARVGGVDTVVVTIPLVAPTSTPRLVAAALRGLPHECIGGDYPARRAVHGQTVVKDNRTWRVGTQSEVAWISTDTDAGHTIGAALPPVFDAYAIVVIPEDEDEQPACESALLRVLTQHTTAQPWWLGYLDTGAHDVVFDDAWKIVLYTGWSYVLVEAGPAEAGTWRDGDAWRGQLPDLVFPADHTWLLSMLWDDDWRCLGGPGDLLRAVLADPELDAHPARVDDEATPPGR